jgi:hypothetical protein
MPYHRSPRKEPDRPAAQPDQEDPSGEYDMVIGVTLVGIALVMLVLIPFLMT